MSPLKQKGKKIYRGSCLCCPRTEDFLPLNTVLYNGFGGYRVTKNGKSFYEGDCTDKAKWEDFWKLSKIERIAQKNPGRWRVILDTPLRGATWSRKEKGKWVLIETNLGFA